MHHGKIPQTITKSVHIRSISDFSEVRWQDNAYNQLTIWPRKGQHKSTGCPKKSRDNVSVLLKKHKSTKAQKREVKSFIYLANRKKIGRSTDSREATAKKKSWKQFSSWLPVVVGPENEKYF